MEETHLESSAQKKTIKAEEMIQSNSESKTSSFSYVKKIFNLIYFLALEIFLYHYLIK